MNSINRPIEGRLVLTQQVMDILNLAIIPRIPK
ncbi:hypothetical protein clg_04 [Corynebacterium phage CL31]|nr:hypothetical protein clg_04 [Corynebacterium phage CL31]